MRAIILAAGKGERLKPYTSDRPKCLVELAGRTLLDYQVEALAAAGIHDICIVTGYQADQLRRLGYPTRHNARYETTNMVASLMCAADLLDGRDDVLIAYADIVYELRIVKALCACDAPICTAVDRAWRQLWQVRMDDPLADAETLKLSEAGEIIELGRKPESYADIEGQYMGLTRGRADAATKFVEAYRRLGPDPAAGNLDDPARLGDSSEPRASARAAFPDGGCCRIPHGHPDPAQMYMTDFLQCLIDHGQPVRAVLVDGGWWEIASRADLEWLNHMHEHGRLDAYCRLMTLQTHEAVQ